jgi:hypothetical protein
VSIRSSSNPELEAFHTPRKSSGVRDRPSSHIPTTRCRHLSGRFSNASASQAPVVLAASYAGPFSPAPPSRGSRRDTRTAIPVPDLADPTDRGPLSLRIEMSGRNARPSRHSHWLPSRLDLERFRHSPFGGRPRHDRATRRCADERAARSFADAADYQVLAAEAGRIGADAGTSDTDSAGLVALPRSAVSV